MDNQDLISMGIEFLKLSDSCLDKVILSKNAIPYFKKATQSLKMGNFIEAISAYDKVIELDSKYFLAYLGKGIAYSHL